MNRKILLAVGAVSALGLAGCVAPLAPQAGNSVDFWYSGGPSSYTVPAGVCSVTVNAYGGAGGSGANATDDSRGWGAQVQATIKVTPGETLQVNPGGRGGDGEATATQLAHGGAGGWNGGGAGGDATPSAVSGPWNANAGGGGGGASDVRQGGTDLANRVVVAGGGGGSGALGTFDDGWGGDGGDPNADDGGDGALSTGGGAGQQGGPGFPGTPGGTWGGYGGGAGATAAGGSVPNSAFAGGGGGAGFFGGGGGGFSGVGVASGGGGGASYAAPSATHVFMDFGVAQGVGEITLTPRKCT
jgi:hypothetical protein